MRSMTGFGRGEASCEAGRLRVEVKTVNHKGFDARVRAPRLLSASEQAVVARLRAAHQARSKQAPAWQARRVPHIRSVQSHQEQAVWVLSPLALRA